MTSEYNLEAYQDDADLIELWLWLDGVSNPTVWLHGISGQAAESQEYKLIGVRDALAFSEKSFMGYGGGFSDVGKLGIPTYAAPLTFWFSLASSIGPFLCADVDRTCPSLCPRPPWPLPVSNRHYSDPLRSGSADGSASMRMMQL